jgi:TRAP-type uncharacterized transport system fused permease subunit
MKKCIVLIVLMISVVYQTFGQSDFYEKKVKNFTRMRSAGYTMLGVGAGLATAGAIALATLPHDYWDDDDEYDVDDDDDFFDAFEDGIQFTAGVCLLGVGVGLVAGGVTMSSIANRKIKIYQGKASDVSLNFNVAPNNQGIRLVYRF